MATYAERALIQRDSTLDPSAAGFVVPSDTTLAAVNGSVAFRRRIQSAVEDVAYDILVAAVGAVPDSGPGRDALVWAQQTTTNSSQATTTALRLVLAEFDAATPATLASVADADIKTFIAGIVPVLASGIVNRR